MENIINVKDMTIAYQEKPVLWNVTLDIKENSRTAIIGPNGAGKSTLMKGILGLVKPVTGKISIKDRTYKQVYKDIAYIPQTGEVNWDFPTTVLDTVMMGTYVKLGWIKRPGKKEKEISLKALEKMGMIDYKDRQISQLSGGQKQRVFLARAIAQNADIYFMDEPLAGVDVTTEKVIMDTLKEFQKDGKTIIVVHHDLSTVEDYFDHVIIVNKKIIASGDIKSTFIDENIKKAYSKVG